MSHYLIEQIEGLSNVEVRTRTEAVAAEGDGRLRALYIRGRDRAESVRGGRRLLPVYRRGTAPFPLETSVGVLVAGDVRARSIKRVASAVGEGSMALVHQYLAEA